MDISFAGLQISELFHNKEKYVGKLFTRQDNNSFGLLLKVEIIESKIYSHGLTLSFLTKNSFETRNIYVSNPFLIFRFLDE